MTSSEAVLTATRTPQNRMRNIADLIVGIAMLALVPWAVWKEGAWPQGALFAVGVIPPMVLLAIRGLRRLLYPAKLPARWPKNSRYVARFAFATVALMAIMAVFMLLTFFSTLSRDRTAHHIYQCVWISGQCWLIFLQRFLEERTYLEPDKSATGGWAGKVGGLYSEHWGGRPPEAERAGEP